MQLSPLFQIAVCEIVVRPRRLQRVDNSKKSLSDYPNGERFGSFTTLDGKQWTVGEMTRGKPVVSRTFAPIHFEDLDPHRFEDLIRELIYDFRDWQSIEATGRSGDDAGFDIRAFEKLPPQVVVEADEEDQSDTRHPMDGPRWMIQGKREKTLVPSDVKKILTDVDANDPPYGYILAASAVFSKKSYDTFRDELRSKGVLEFYLWGRAELEDMLHLPKNDRILFTFFGISLVSRRRSRTTEVRSGVNIKNKLHRVLGDPQAHIDKPVLIRDINDTHYPFADEYPDFKKRPRWIERTVARHHPNGLFVENQQFYAYMDRDKKEWDFTEHANAFFYRRTVISDEDGEEHSQNAQDVLAIWNFLPRSKQGMLTIAGFLAYADIVLVDPEGDAHYRHPHLYAEFSAASGPYSGFHERLSVRGKKMPLDEAWRRIDFFPKSFVRSSVKRRIHTEKINLDVATLKGLKDYTLALDTLFALDDRFDFLQQRDVVEVANSVRESYGSDRDIEVRHIYKGPFVQYLNEVPDKYSVREAAKRQIGREVGDDEPITVLEVEFTFVPRNEE
jgi:hypothetical protein